jgi:sterol desaturase/sphingolipid hydroxylase (fatty acid hydroxylase superfamily)
MGALAVKPVALGLSTWASARRFGLLHVVEFPFAAQLIAGFLLLDLTFYYWHRANHGFAILWRFHNVHHIDPDLDASTAFRFHFGEVLYSTGFRALQVSLLGISPAVLIIYEIVFQCATIFHHSNIRIPIRVERWLNKIVVTPRMHGIHHSIVENETNSNYSVVFRWWDAVHRSLRLNIHQSGIIIGVAGYQASADNTLLKLFALPFLRQREYWRMPDGRYSVREEVMSEAQSELRE